MEQVSGPVFGSLHTKPRVFPAADPTDVAREQLDFLAEHAANGFCVVGCHDCALLLAVRSLLLERFQATELKVKPIGWSGAKS